MATIVNYERNLFMILATRFWSIKLVPQFDKEAKTKLANQQIGSIKPFTLVINLVKQATKSLSNTHFHPSQ